MRYLLLILLLPLAAQSRADQCFCLESKAGKGFRLKMSLAGDDWKTGTVQYKGQPGNIALRFAGARELERNPGRPSYFRYTWYEVIGGKVTGTYVVCIQGANIYESWYLRAKDKKKFRLERVMAEDECTDCL